jgi:hypothetical protein
MNLPISRRILSIFLTLQFALVTFSLPSFAEETPTAGVEVRNCVKLKSGKARLIDETVKKCKKNEKLVYLKFPSGFVAFPGAKGAGILSGKGIPNIELGNIGDFYLDSENHKLYGPKNETDIWGTGVSLIGPQGPAGFSGGGSRGPAGPTGATGPQGPAGITLGYNGYFIDNTTETITTTSKAIPFNTTVFSSGVSIANNAEGTPRKTRITFANAGKYNIQFSSQLFNQGKKGVVFTLWLTKNGTSVTDSSTDVYVGTSTDTERHAIAWNFFVDAAANDWFELTAVSSDSVQILSGASQNALLGAPTIPGTILTVNQVG